MDRETLDVRVKILMEDWGCSRSEAVRYILKVEV